MFILDDIKKLTLSERMSWPSRTTHWLLTAPEECLDLLGSWGESTDVTEAEVLFAGTFWFKALVTSSGGYNHCLELF